MRDYERQDLCGVDFNDTQWGWDTCTKPPNHVGDHYDDISKQYGHNHIEQAKPKHKRPLWMRR